MTAETIDKALLELWGHNDKGGTRNPLDILAYFESLDTAGRAAMTSRMVEDAFRLGKLSDTEVIARGLSFARERGYVSANQALPA
jgi:translation initiation factor 4G